MANKFISYVKNRKDGIFFLQKSARILDSTSGELEKIEPDKNSLIWVQNLVHEI
jgi:hypothetical protein